MFLYHATKYKNFASILNDQKIKTGADGLIYFTTTQHHSVNWIDFTNHDAEDIIVFRVLSLKLDQSKIDDGYDHDPNFFKGITVKTYAEDISLELVDMDNVMQFISRHKQGV